MGYRARRNRKRKKIEGVSEKTLNLAKGCLKKKEVTQEQKECIDIMIKDLRQLSKIFSDTCCDLIGFFQGFK